MLPFLLYLSASELLDFFNLSFIYRPVSCKSLDNIEFYGKNYGLWIKKFQRFNLWFSVLWISFIIHIFEASMWKSPNFQILLFVNHILSTWGHMPWWDFPHNTFGYFQDLYGKLYGYMSYLTWRVSNKLHLNVATSLE